MRCRYASALLALACAGCAIPEAGPGVLVGGIVDWDAPGIAPSPEPGVMLNASVVSDVVLWAGVSVYGNGAGAGAVSLESALHVGWLLFNYDLDREVAPSFAPVVGVWTWGDSPEDAGLLTGIRAGVTWLPRDERSFVLARIECGLVTMHDASGDDDAKARYVALSVVW